MSGVTRTVFAMPASFFGGRSESMNAQVEKTGPMSPCAVERAAIEWEERALEIVPWYSEEAAREWEEKVKDILSLYVEKAYARGRAAGLREALAILGREE
jgi:hypothetical protein